LMLTLRYAPASNAPSATPPSAVFAGKDARKRVHFTPTRHFEWSLRREKSLFALALSAGVIPSAVEGSWLDVNTGTVAGIISYFHDGHPVHARR
jgi:hypothetical protein